MIENHTSLSFSYFLLFPPILLREFRSVHVYYSSWYWSSVNHFVQSSGDHHWGLCLKIHLYILYCVDMLQAYPNPSHFLYLDWKQRKIEYLIIWSDIQSYQSANKSEVFHNHRDLIAHKDIRTFHSSTCLYWWLRNDCNS